jgi:hypothetical protein
MRRRRLHNRRNHQLHHLHQQQQLKLKLLLMELPKNMFLVMYRIVSQQHLVLL